jgi:hypothetical protein
MKNQNQVHKSDSQPTPILQAQISQGTQPPRPPIVKEFKVVAVRECPIPPEMMLCETPEAAAAYWRLNIGSHPYYNGEAECLSAILLNTRRRVRGHQFITIGTMDTILVHPREIFRAAVINGAAAIVLIHNHPSGDPSPSEADIKVTRDLIRAGEILKIAVLDHIIMGKPTQERPKDYCSLREHGCFYDFCESPMATQPVRRRKSRKRQPITRALTTSELKAREMRLLRKYRDRILKRDPSKASRIKLPQPHRLTLSRLRVFKRFLYFKCQHANIKEDSGCALV